MTTVEEIKTRIGELFAEQPVIHINLNRPRKRLQNVVVTISSVHSRFFIIEHDDAGLVMRYTVRYDEVLTGELEVLEF